MRILSFSLMLLWSLGALSDLGPPEGFSWFVDPALEEKEVSLKPPQEMETKEIRKAFEEAVELGTAVPSLKNVTRAREIQKEIERRATKFGEMWQAVTLNEPEAFKGKGSSNPHARRIYESEKQLRLEEKLQALSKDHGLFFFVKADCPYCQEFRPIVQAFAKTYGFELKTILVGEDATGTERGAERDNGAAALLNPDGLYPALFLAHPETGTVYPLSLGLISSSELLEHAEIILSQMEAQHGA